VAISVSVIAEMSQTDLSQGAGISEMIGFSVRLAVPFIFLAMAASSFQMLFPGPLAKWWLRNRRYIGLCFAVGMAWQALFIFTVSTVYRPYYLEEIYYFRDELEGSLGYLFMAAMVATSFRFSRRHLDQTQWKIIQKGGIYILWGYAFSVYWWNLFYYGDPRTLDYLYYAAGFLAFSLRIAAWAKSRQKKTRATGEEQSVSGVARLVGNALILTGLIVAITGGMWQEAVTEFMTTPAWSAQMELWLPFWPLEPFYSLMLIAAGAALLAPLSQTASSAPAKVAATGR
jgi:DMSO/TMAO reductase YedYZ heme-binding membrane subunit